MNADDVAQFLRTHPDFFERHPQLLETIYVPHPHGGRAIPLAERQLVSLREKARVLESKLAELVRFGEENDAIGERVHRLSAAMLAARDFSGAAGVLYLHLREDFAVPHVALRVWGRALAEGCAEGMPVPEAQREQASRLGGPQCGLADAVPFLDWFGEAAAHVRSVALVPIGESGVLGLLVLGSEDPQRFYAEMGTLYLRRIGELCTAGLLGRL